MLKHDNDRFTTKCIKVIPNIDTISLLCCDSMYASSTFDGRLKIM